MAALLAGCVAAPVTPGPTQPTSTPYTAPLPPVSAAPTLPETNEAMPVLVGTVISVTDGDTVRVQLSSGPMAVRFHSIDAPEKNQPWGPEARAALASRLDGRQVELEVWTQDRYERLVATVHLGGENINAWMVQEGHAWAYRDYLKDPQYCYAEADARARRLGLWSLPSTSTYAPWEWRAHQRDASNGFTDYSRETASNCIAAMHGRRVANAGTTLPMPPPVPSAPTTGCRIKGNISQSGQIYHVPGSPSYDQTKIDESKGERWFCTEAEARAAGWRAPR
jgi:endonuclease YncB( thermonuclease family)